MRNSSDDNEWTTVQTFNWIQEALVLRTKLESEGIETNIPEENLSSINPFATGMTVRLQVRREKFEAAKALLSEGAHESTPSPFQCPYCGSTHAVPEIYKRTWYSAFLAFLGLLLEIPMRSPRVGHRCGSCHKRF